MLKKIHSLALRAIRSITSTTRFGYTHLKISRSKPGSATPSEARIDMSAFEFDLAESSVIDDFALSRTEVKKLSDLLLGSSPLQARFDQHRGSLRIDADSFRLVIATDDTESAEKIVAMTHLADCQALLVGEGAKTRFVISSTDFTYGIHPRSIKYEEKEIE